MLRLISVAILAAIVVPAVPASLAGAKGPYRVVLSGGDLAAPITVGKGIDDRAMFGDGKQIEPPLPYAQFIYTLELHYEGEEATVPSVSTISYYPAHDGLPAAFQTSSGSFFAVAEDFDSRLRAVLPTREAGGGTSPLWYVVPGVALGLALVGGGFAAWSVRRRKTPRRLTGVQS